MPRKKLIGQTYREDALTGMLKTSGFRLANGESKPTYSGFGLIIDQSGQRVYYDGGLGRTFPENTKRFLDEVHRLFAPFEKRERRIALDWDVSNSKHYWTVWENADAEMDVAVDEVIKQCPVLAQDSVIVVVFSEKWTVYTPLIRVFVASHHDLRV